MDVNDMIAQLRSRKQMVEEAIFSLERIAAGSGKRRGRPPAWLKAVQEGVPAEAPVMKPAKRRVTSIRAGRKKQGENNLPAEKAS